MNSIDFSSGNRLAVIDDGMADARRPDGSTLTGANPTTNSLMNDAGHTDSTNEQPRERWNRVRRAMEEPKWMSGESYQDYLARRQKLGFMPPVDPPSPSGWAIAGEILLGLLIGGPGFGVGAKPTPARAIPRPSFSVSSRATGSSESIPLIPLNSRTPPRIEPPSARIRPPLKPIEGSGAPVEGTGTEIGSPGRLPQSTTEATVSEPEPLTEDAWGNQSKDGLNDALVQKINDAFEDGQDVRVHTSKSGKKTYLIYDPDDRAYLSIESNETWYPTEIYDYKQIGTWKTGKQNQQYAPIEKFDSSREELIQARIDSAKAAIENGVLLDPVKVKEVIQGGTTRFEIVDGNHRNFAGRRLGLSTIPYEIVDYPPIAQ
ncbi:ParB N-terminal domain-containing protein [Burkholderia ubonensis]|uniref:ParB N-terminal domain-containing protein n=1 Tax=Burkholderia ubonensis TaxID=101571 RepID=UPI0012FC4528|nr:ParB N-terminal domain-containing protein [Burkholderia ubonensis]